MLIRDVPVARSGWLDGYEHGDEYRSYGETERLAQLLPGKPIQLDHGGREIGRVGKTRVVPHDDGERWVHADLDVRDDAMPAVRAGKHYCSVTHLSHRRYYLDDAGRDPGVGAQLIRDVRHLALTSGARCGEGCRIPAEALAEPKRTDAAPAPMRRVSRVDFDPSCVVRWPDDDKPLHRGDRREDSSMSKFTDEATTAAEAAARARNARSYRQLAPRDQRKADASDFDDPSIAPPLRSKSAEQQRGGSATVGRDLNHANMQNTNYAKPDEKATPTGEAYGDPDPTDEVETADSLAEAEAKARQRSAQASRTPHPKYSRKAILAKDDARRQGHRADDAEPEPITTSLAEAEAKARARNAAAYLRPYVGKGSR